MDSGWTTSQQKTMLNFEQKSYSSYNRAFCANERVGNQEKGDF